ncbi:MAG: hypothetical protein M1383_02985 [Patescibacteria group bacterium]|nr:hypothetical protein [Patescibacteria group bacterium]
MKDNEFPYKDDSLEEVVTENGTGDEFGQPADFGSIDRDIKLYLEDTKFRKTKDTEIEKEQSREERLAENKFQSNLASLKRQKPYTIDQLEFIFNIRWYKLSRKLRANTPMEINGNNVIFLEKDPALEKPKKQFLSDSEIKLTADKLKTVLLNDTGNGKLHSKQEILGILKKYFPAFTEAGRLKVFRELNHYGFKPVVSKNSEGNFSTFYRL